MLTIAIMLVYVGYFILKGKKIFSVKHTCDFFPYIQNTEQNCKFN